MPKKKKTREQKLLADKRREVTNQGLYTFTSTPPKSHAAQPLSSHRQTATTISTTSYKYLAGDLRKTFLFTLFIMVTELVIYYFL